MIFKRTAEGRPYPKPSDSPAAWDALPVVDVMLADLIPTQRVVDVHRLLAHPDELNEAFELRVVQFEGELFIESGLHSALRAAMELRTGLPARVLLLK